MPSTAVIGVLSAVTARDNQISNLEAKRAAKSAERTLEAIDARNPSFYAGIKNLGSGRGIDAIA
jgi:hypothetical protein